LIALTISQLSAPAVQLTQEMHLLHFLRAAGTDRARCALFSSVIVSERVLANEVLLLKMQATIHHK
jgi:hypothetical protein